MPKVISKFQKEYEETQAVLEENINAFNALIKRQFDLIFHDVKNSQNAINITNNELLELQNIKNESVYLGNNVDEHYENKAVDIGKKVLPFMFLDPISSAIFAIIALSKSNSNKKTMSILFKAYHERMTYKYKLAISEIQERGKRIINEYGFFSSLLNEIKEQKTPFDQMDESQKYRVATCHNYLFSYLNLLKAPIESLQFDFSEEDYFKYEKKKQNFCDYVDPKYINLIIYIANLVYERKVSDKEKKAITQFIKDDEKILKLFNLTKKDITLDIIEEAIEASKFKQYVC